MPFDATYYRQVYRDYEAQNPPAKLKFYASVIERHLAAGTPRRIHDMGCAFGAFLAALDASWQKFGSDVSAAAIDQARTRVPEATLAIADGASPPFRELFGVITAFDVIEHIENLDEVAESINRQLLVDGLFVFVVPVYEGLTGPVIRYLDRDPTHLHKWGSRRWLQWAERHFDVLDWQGILRYLVLPTWYMHLTTRRLRDHTPAIIVACRKRKRLA